MSEYGLTVYNAFNDIQIDSTYQNFAVAEEISVSISSGQGATNQDISVDFVNTYTDPPLIGAKLSKSTSGADTCANSCQYGTPYFAGFKKYKFSGGKYSGMYLSYGLAGHEHGVQFTAYVFINANDLPPSSDTHGLVVRDIDNKVVFHSGFKYWNYKGSLSYDSGDNWNDDPGSVPYYSGEWKTYQKAWDYGTESDLGGTAWPGDGGGGWTYPDMNFFNGSDRVPQEGWHNASAPAFNFGSYGGYYHQPQSIDFTGNGTFGHGSVDGYTFHGSPWESSYLDDHHVKTMDTSGFQYGGADTTIFLINEVAGLASYDIGFVKHNSFFNEAMVASTPILVRRDNNKVSIQACVTGITNHWYGTGSYAQWTAVYLIGIQVGNINVPYGEVGA